MKYLKYLLLLLPLDVLAHPGHDGPTASFTQEGVLWIAVVALSLGGLYALFGSRARRGRTRRDD